MPKKNQGWITFQASSEERELLETYCQATQRSKTDVLRELVRQLARPTPVAAAAAPPPPTDLADQSAVPIVPPFQVSARNLLRGRITNLYRDGVNTEVTLEVAPQVEITAVITSSSAQRLGLQVGRVVYALVKSSNVLIATGQALEQWADSWA